MPTALELIQVITPSVLSLPVLALALPPAGAPAELPGIRAITVKTVTPRRGFILLCLVLLAATCAAETLVLIADVLSARYRDPEGGRHSHSAWFVAASAAHALGGLCIYSLAAIFAEFRLRWGDKMLVLLSVVAWGLEVPYLVLSVIREVHVGEYRHSSMVVIVHRAGPLRRVSPALAQCTTWTAQSRQKAHPLLAPYRISS